MSDVKTVILGLVSTAALVYAAGDPPWGLDDHQGDAIKIPDPHFR